MIYDSILSFSPFFFLLSFIFFLSFLAFLISSYLADRKKVKKSVETTIDRIDRETQESTNPRIEANRHAYWHIQPQTEEGKWH